MVAGDEIDRWYFPRPSSHGHSVHRPSRATTNEIIAPAGSDMQMLPPTVAAFQILKEASKASQQARISGAASHSLGGSKR